MADLTRRDLVRLAAPAALLGACAAPTSTPDAAHSPAAAPAPSSGSGAAASGSAASTPTVSASSTPAVAPTSSSPAQLPRGGTRLFPDHRLVGFCGVPGSAAMGRLGIGDLDERVRELEAVAGDYADGRAPLPVLELISTVVHGTPGRDGLYRTRIREQVIADHVAAARRHKALLLLNIQPGRATFPDEVAAYERWLREPDVGLALDPEWRMHAGEVPMKVFGHVDAAELNEVGQWVSNLVAAHHLPEKAVVVHQLAPRLIRNEPALRAFPGMAWVKSVDGIGSAWMKQALWDKVTPGMPAVWHPGFKLFYEEDVEHGPLMTPRQVLALRPTPEYVMHE